MEGRTLIDGLDIYTNYGMFVTNGGHDQIVAWPPLKAPAINDWPDEDGIEVDLSHPVLDTKNALVTFAMMPGGSLAGFMAKISDRAFHTFTFYEIGHEYHLRLLAQDSLKLRHDGQAFRFGLAFCDDFPNPYYSYLAPNGNAPMQPYGIDGKSLSDYGIAVLQGTEAELKKSPPVKINLVRKFAKQPGALNDTGETASTYDGEFVYYKSKEVTLNCLLRASDLTQFWRNYKALLFDLIRPGERLLMHPAIGTPKPCYYKNMNIVKLITQGEIWCRFNIVLEFTNYRY